MADLWNTLQKLEVNSKDVYLYLLAEHYGIDYENSVARFSLAVGRQEKNDEETNRV